MTKQGLPIRQVSKRLGVSTHSLHAWKRKLAKRLLAPARSRLKSAGPVPGRRDWNRDRGPKRRAQPSFTRRIRNSAKPEQSSVASTMGRAVPS
ncbi:MAG: transposase [Paracoccus sp. (in: a-proteobacteria)]